ncbi:MAG: sigE 46, partial [Gemmataceae bacterium]|nr:sigE 46 [Gemmataceae bacterium]
MADLTHRLSRLVLTASAEPDGNLLGRFVAERDGEAFAELVRRHGPMVLA